MPVLIRSIHNSLMWSIRAEMKINNKQEALMAHTIAPLEVDHASISIVMDNSIDLLMSSTVEQVPDESAMSRLFYVQLHPGPRCTAG